MTRSLSKEAAAARVAANWERFKDRFVGKTDQELRDIADNYFKTAHDPEMLADGIYESNRSFYRNGCYQTQVCLVTNQADLTAYAFAVEEELLKRGLNR